MEDRRFARIYMQIWYTASSRLIALSQSVSRGAQEHAVVGILSVYLHNVPISLAKGGGTEAHMDCIYNRRDDVCTVLVVPERLNVQKIGRTVTSLWKLCSTAAVHALLPPRSREKGSVCMHSQPQVDGTPHFRPERLFNSRLGDDSILAVSVETLKYSQPERDA